MDEIKMAFKSGLVSGFGIGWGVCCLVWAVVLIVEKYV